MGVWGHACFFLGKQTVHSSEQAAGELAPSHAVVVSR